MSEHKLKITQEQAREMPMVDVAFLILKAGNTPQYYRDLMQEVAKVKGIPEDEIMNVIAQLYTEINIDGRFACVGNNLWGLKRWYPVDKGEDSIANSQRPRIINDDDDDFEDDHEFESEEETDDFDGDEDFDGDDFDGDDLDEDAEEEIDEELDEDLDADEEIDEDLEEDAEFEEDESDEDSFDELDDDADDDK